MAYDYRQLDIYAGLTDSEITAEMRRRKQNLPKLFPKIMNGEQITCVVCERGYYINKKTSFYCSVCDHQVIFN